MSFDETTEITEIPNAPRELREETTREAVVARDAGTTGVNSDFDFKTRIFVV